MDQQKLLADVRTQLLRRAQSWLDKTTPHPLARWLALGALLALYALRVWRLDGWFIVTYGLAIYVLNLFIGFISPQADPDADGGGGGGGGGASVLPISGGGGGGGGAGGARGGLLDASESKGFARKVPEFKFWFAAVRATLTAFCMTCSEVFNLPVFWPILVLYFLVLLVVTLRKQIAHMVKHRYMPCSFGKPTYQKKGAGAGGSGGGQLGGAGAAAAMWKGSSQ
jgi:hypothetical protein